MHRVNHQPVVNPLFFRKEVPKPKCDLAWILTMFPAKLDGGPVDAPRVPVREKKVFVKVNVTHLQKIHDTRLRKGGPNMNITNQHNPLFKPDIRYD
jgi:hypothetical protein